MVFAKTRFAVRDPTRRLGGVLAAQRAVSDRSWIDLAACKERRRMELTLGHHGAILDFATAEEREDRMKMPAQMEITISRQIRKRKTRVNSTTG